MKLKDIPQNPEDVIIQNIPSHIIPIINRRNIVVNNNIDNDNMNLSHNAPVIPVQETEEINSSNNIVPVVQPLIEEKEIILNEEESIQNLKKDRSKYSGIYKITAVNGPIKIPEGYATNDVDEYNAIQIINDDLSTWKVIIDKPNYKIYSKPFRTRNEKGEEGESRMFYLDATIDSPASEVNRQINTFELRKVWEDSLKKGQLINKEDLGNGIKIIDYYAYIKMPLIFADRDIVVRKKIWENYNGEKDCCLNEMHSIELPEFPAKSRPIRARLENKSKYIKPISSHKTKLYYVSKFDMKISLGGDVMDKKGAQGTEKWFKDFLKQL
jgi:hypothetical protein